MKDLCLYFHSNLFFRHRFRLTAKLQEQLVILQNALSWVYLTFHHYQIQIMPFWQECHISKTDVSYKEIACFHSKIEYNIRSDCSENDDTKTMFNYKKENKHLLKESQQEQLQTTELFSKMTLEPVAIFCLQNFLCVSSPESV